MSIKIGYEKSNCHHEVIWQPGVRGQKSPPSPYPGPPALKFPFKMDPFQQTSINCLEAGHNLLLSAHTSAGKTAVVHYAFAMAHRDNKHAIYTSPIKALSNQKYREFNEIFQDIGLMTGDMKINHNATCLVMTTEILRSMLYNGSGFTSRVRTMIHDEIHNIRDKKRGFVWEESIILAPKSCRFIFLSATIPNAREFADWISQMHGSPCHVVYTNYRPIPLNHYIYPKGGNTFHLIVDENSRFDKNQLNEAFDTLTKSNFSSKNLRKTITCDQMNNESSSTDILKVIKLVMELKYDPAIVFCFSKKDCEALAVNVSSNKYNTDVETHLVEYIYWSALDSLSEYKTLPQVDHLLPLLKQGIGVHHSGLLPILKELTEIIFQEELIKVLFATDTFSSGLNMPAKTVIFSSIQKFDGESFRTLSSGEYVQMSGRAGRRGLDNKGIVVLMIDKETNKNETIKAISSKSEPIQSEFRLNYLSILNSMRTTTYDPRNIARQSYKQFQTVLVLPSIQKKIESLEQEYNYLKTHQKSAADLMQDLLCQALINRLGARTIIHSSPLINRYLNPGRLVKVISKDVITLIKSGCMIDLEKILGCRECCLQNPTTLLSKSEGHWGVIMDHKVQENNTANVTTKKLNVLVNCNFSTLSSNSKAPINMSRNTRVLNSYDKSGTPTVICVHLHQISKISRLAIKLPENRWNHETLSSIMKSIADIEKKFNSKGGIPELDAILDFKATKNCVRKYLKLINAIDELISENSKILNSNELYWTKHLHNFEPSNSQENPSEIEKSLYLRNIMRISHRKKIITEEMKKYLHAESLAHTIITNHDVLCMQRVLTRLGYINDKGFITVKGHFACELSLSNVLTLTELFFSGVFKTFSDEQICALLTCFVCSEKCSYGSCKLSKELEEALASFETISTNVANIQRESGLQVNVNGRHSKWHPSIIHAVVAWYKEIKFTQVIKLSKAFEGSLIRYIRRLDELVGQLATASRLLGEENIFDKINSIRVKIKRGIIFTTSLYFY